MIDAAEYSDKFLAALGAWQTGWAEKKDQRLERTSVLHAAIIASPSLPPEAFEAPKVCFRKRFLEPNNPQNGGDMWPFFWDGEISEGVASWSTDFNYCKVIFKTAPRPGTIACIFRYTPAPQEVVLNIEKLWTRPDFAARVEQYRRSGGSHADGLLHFKAVQSEVILDAPLRMDDVIAFCGQVPSLQSLCATAGIASAEDEEDLWQKLVARNLLETSPYWLDYEASQRTLDAAAAKVEKLLAPYLKPKV